MRADLRGFRGPALLGALGALLAGFLITGAGPLALATRLGIPGAFGYAAVATVTLAAFAAAVHGWRRAERRLLIERKRVAEVEASAYRMRAYLEHSADIITLLDASGTILYESPAIEHVLGYSPDELVGENAFAFVHPEDLEYVQEVFRDGLPSAATMRTVQYRFRHRDGTWRWLQSVGIYALNDPGIEGIIVSSGDITRRKETEQQLARAVEEMRALSLTDELTGLLNRRGFFALAEQELKRSERLPERLALLYVDVDDLKQLNDTRGHFAGDRALQDLATLLRETFRKSDVIGRIGGDEFAVLALARPPDSGSMLARRLRERGGEFLESGRASSRVTFTIGQVELEAGDSADLESLLAEADRNMYAEKRRRTRASD